LRYRLFESIRRLAVDRSARGDYAAEPALSACVAAYRLGYSMDLVKRMVVGAVFGEMLVIVGVVRLVTLDMFVARAAMHDSLACRSRDGTTDCAHCRTDWTAGNGAHNTACDRPCGG
jgi:hypothetical protein